MNTSLKRTPLVAEHEQAGARMVDFGGWYMPVQYAGVMAEHEAVRRRVGLFDVSHMGEIRVGGPDAVAFLNHLTVNDAAALEDNQAQYSAFANEAGGVIDDLLVYRYAADDYLLVVNASTREKDLAWIQRWAGGWQVSVVDESDATGQIAIQGPRAAQVLQPLCAANLAEIAYYRFSRTDIQGIDALVSRTGYTGEDGFECYVAAGDTPALWRLLLAAGKSAGIEPAGLGARDTLRLEARMNLYGNDMDETTSVLEAGLGWITKFKKGDFIGRTALLEQKKAGLTRRLVGFQLLDKGIARHGYPVVADGQTVGHVTSGTHSPTLKKSIGLAYVPAAGAEPGTIFQISIRDKPINAQIIKGAFYTRP